ncbi:MAG: U32 family peptidase, partial [Bacilli bacterium]|nr:U32 family peptidase [Bacilli bacterium]
MKRIELLSPAGTYEAFLASVQNGADAVYLGGKLFGARAYAANFDNEDLVNIIKYAHAHNVKVYITVNTIVFNKEIEELIKFLDFIYLNDVDAVIVQDLGIINLIKNRYKNLDIIASTQMNIHNIEGAQRLKQLGIKRVVIARETDLQTIRKILDEVDIEVEVFAHGALCVCYSGECLLSSFIGKRSGNRGKCAQPCRLSYTLLCNNEKVSEEKYLLSMKDLCTLDNLDEIIKSGVGALKIEGRMKSSEYVA